MKVIYAENWKKNKDSWNWILIFFLMKMALVYTLNRFIYMNKFIKVFLILNIYACNKAPLPMSTTKKNNSNNSNKTTWKTYSYQRKSVFLCFFLSFPFFFGSNLTLIALRAFNLWNFKLFHLQRRFYWKLKFRMFSMGPWLKE